MYEWLEKHRGHEIDKGKANLEGWTWEKIPERKSLR
jgi:hypothetical protein